MTRTDIPPALLARATSLGPSILAALLATYPTDEQHERMEREKQRKRRQLQIRFKETA